MRWTSKETPTEGDERVINRFLFFPKLLGEEWRWLEWAEYKQRYAVYEYSSNCWEDKEWINK